MKRIIYIVFICFLIILVITGYYRKRYFYPRNRLKIANEQVNSMVLNNQIKDGDIIFQTSLSQQSKAIQLATHSKFSHCGIIYKINSDYFVFEAVQPVKLTSLVKWIARGDNAHYVIKRLKQADLLLTPEKLEEMKKVGESYKGKDYDIYFEWSDDKIYCSELIWKMYKRSTGIEIGKLQKLHDFDLSRDEVRKIMKARYGDKTPPDDTVISPVSIYNSELLETVRGNY
jgi:Permuted papain-like amidase enzyme, YaeF/YiiX, C92 family